MATISQQLLHERRMLGRGRRMIEKSGETIRSLLMRFADEDLRPGVSLPKPPSIDPDMLHRAARALREAGYKVSNEHLLAATSQRFKSVPVTEPHDQLKDLRLIEPVGRDRFRCNVRRGRGKRRLIPEIFTTYGEARAARDALEFLLGTGPTSRARAGRDSKNVVSKAPSGEGGDLGTDQTPLTVVTDHGGPPLVLTGARTRGNSVKFTGEDRARWR